MAQPFVASSRHGNAWFSVGPASSFPNIAESGTITLSDKLICSGSDTAKQGCKAFLGPDPKDGTSQATRLSDDPKEQLNASLRKGDQVLVFQYKGKFHAIDNVRLFAFHSPRLSSTSLKLTTKMKRNAHTHHTRFRMVLHSTSKTLVLHSARGSRVLSMGGVLICSRARRIGGVIG
jgi:hypothetical protein